MKQTLDYLEDWLNSQVTKAFYQTWEQINTLILDVSKLKNGFGSIMQENVDVSDVLGFIWFFNYHIAADGHEERDHALTNDFLNIWTVY